MKKMLGTVALSLLLGSANAALMTDSIDNGWYNSLGTHGTTNTNVFSGNSRGNIYRSFYSFDLSGLSGNIGSASIVFFGGNGINTLNAANTLDLWDVSDIASIAGGGQGIDGFNDLGEGEKYGSQSVSACGDCSMPELTLSLSAAAIVDINAAMGTGLFGVGNSLRFDPEIDNGLWTSSYGIPAARLELDVAAVSEPPIIALFAMGLVSIGFSRLKRS